MISNGKSCAVEHKKHCLEQNTSIKLIALVNVIDVTVLIVKEWIINFLIN